MKVAIITGANGQDGYYLQEFLKYKGYSVKCFNREDNILHYSNVRACISGYDEVEIYNLAAQSYVGTHDKHTYELNTVGLLNILESVKELGLTHRCKVFQASSSETYGTTLYGISKLSADLIAKYYRENHGVFVCSGILYNHESPRRKDTFVTQKIIQGLKSGEPFTLGNLEARRDWGHAKDYVEAMWLMLQQSVPDDYVVATGVTHSVREFIEITVHKMGKKIIWSDHGEGLIDGKVIVKTSEVFYRPDDPGVPPGDPSKIESLGWVRKYTLEDVIEEMLSHPSD